MKNTFKLNYINKRFMEGGLPFVPVDPKCSEFDIGMIKNIVFYFF